tara:strand:- start:1312 stop:1479 length:168 start_codon:yes stop_codon:yes gene_type:complete
LKPLRIYWISLGLINKKSLVAFSTKKDSILSVEAKALRMESNSPLGEIDQVSTIE